MVTPVIDYSTANNRTNPNMGDSSRPAMMFVPDANYTISQAIFRVNIAAGGSTGGDLIFEIRDADSTGKPGSTVLATGSHASNSLGFVSGEAETTNLSFDASVDLTAGTTYALLLYRGSAGPYAREIAWNLAAAIAGSSGVKDKVGRGWFQTSTSGSWSDPYGGTSTDNDRLFKLLGVTSSNPDAGQSLSAGIFIDFNANESFDSTEAITADVMRASWIRGKEPEQETTPVGTMQIVISDPLGNYVPDSTFWGSSNMDINREVKATIDYDGTTYSLFRGRINSIRPNVRPGNDQTVTLFCVDEKEILNTKVISLPNSAQTTGGASPDGDDPYEGLTFGSSTDGSTGVISLILDESSLASDRRVINEEGSTADLYWTYGVTAKAALDEVEKHEGKRSMLFINSCGSLEFHSSTHRNGSTYAISLGPNSTHGILFQSMEFEKSARNVLNAAEVTIKTYITTTGSVQEIPEPNVSVTPGSVYEWIVPLNNAPVSSVTAPLNARDSTSGVSIRGITSGDTYADDSHSGLLTMTVLGGGSAVKFTLDNTDTAITESIAVRRPENYTISDTGFFPLVTQPHNISDVTQESCDPASITRYGRRFKSFSFPFFGSLDPDLSTGSTNTKLKAGNRATAEIANNSTAHADGIRLSLAGTDSDSITQILTRNMNDRIRVNSTAQLRLSNRDFYITKGEWNLDVNQKIGVTWTLQEAT